MDKNKSFKTKLKKGDTVRVVSGNNKGTTGKILLIDRVKGRVIVEGVNIRSKHTKASQKNPQGGITKRESGINISNVQYVDKGNNAVRLGTKVIKDDTTGKNKRMRFNRKSDEIII